MDCYVDDSNDLDIILIEYSNLYFKELTYYGTSKNEHMLLLLSLGSKLNVLEKTLIDKYYNKYISEYKNDKLSKYNMEKIIFGTTNIINNMVRLWVLNHIDIDEYEFKSRYLVGCLENFVNKIILPIEDEMENILNLNKIFKINNSFDHFIKFISLNQNKFLSQKKVDKLNKFIKILNDIS